MSSLSQIDAYLRHYLEAEQLVGLAVVVVQDDAITFRGTYGVQNRQTRQPVTPQTLFHIASVAKTMTSTAIMQLREQGKLSLDDPLVKHLPYFQVDDPRSAQITIRQCLYHVSGIGHPEDYGWDRPEFDDEALERHVRGLASHKLLELGPGEVSYSDIAFNVLGDLIAKVSGLPYEQYMKTQIFDPLGMTTTTLMAPRSAHPELVATGYEKQVDGTIVESFYPYNRMHVPCGCIASSAFEMAQWCRVHLTRGEVDGVRILQPESYGELWQRQVRASNTRHADPALGWWINRHYQQPVLQHDGEDDGFVSNLRLWPERKLGMVALCNAVWAAPEEICDEIYQILVAG